MLNTTEIIEKLSAPFPPSAIRWRVGSTNAKKLGVPANQATKGIPLAYIDARDAMERLDSVVGAENWQRRYPWSDGHRLCCEVGIRINDEWIWKSDGGGDTQVEAEKGAFSDAFKRACVNWGIARYLYDMPNVWIDLDKGRIGDPKSLTERLATWQGEYFNKRKAA